MGEVEVFYREAGPKTGPPILLLHGFPTSSHMFRDLLPILAKRHRVIAPDLPGFGNTRAPPRGRFDYTFDALAQVVDAFAEALGLSRYVLYVSDYGAPTGFRLALAHPERLRGIVSQNGNAYELGLGGAWDPWRTYWRNPTRENREICRDSLSPAAIRDLRYLHGAPKGRVSPDGYTLDIAYMARPGAAEIQLDLILDYRTNVALYPASRPTFASGNPRYWPSGARTIPLFRRREPRLIGSTSQRPRFDC